MELSGGPSRICDGGSLESLGSPGDRRQLNKTGNLKLSGTDEVSGTCSYGPMTGEGMVRHYGVGVSVGKDQ